MSTRILAAVAALLAVGVGVGAYAVLQGLQREDEDVVPLARADGWRDALGAPFPGPAAILEIAADRETAERAWQENVPDDLPDRTGPPDEPGIYGSLDEVDFDREAVVVWSAGGSSSCPPWLSGVDTAEDGRVELETDDAAGPQEACTDDYSPYRMLLAVSRDRLPPADELPTEDVVVDVPLPPPGAVVTTYPADPSG